MAKMVFFFEKRCFYEHGFRSAGMFLYMMSMMYVMYVMYALYVMYIICTIRVQLVEAEFYA